MSQTAIAVLIGAVLLSGSFIMRHGDAVAQVMQSSSYQIQSDSLNIGGGYSSSSNYVSESTFGEVGTGKSDSSSYSLRAGYQQMQEVYVAISAVSNVIMSPTIPGVTGGIANGSTTVVVTTDSVSGYDLTIESENSPAMQKGADTIADYTPSSTPPDFTFTTDITDSHFGYTPEGPHIVQRYQDDTSACNTGSSDTALACWDGLTTSPVTIASDTNPNHPNGATTTLYFRVGIGGSVVQAPGTYTATTTLTALPR